ncbi:hypothetical protein R3I93_017405 [Phoxinus phoxinus]|uniref:Uncharacterized protein n=1 Tax=Phoxinus phoxinus TaxID=58324 RepID=A0AAN9CK66_9TELE
MMQYKCFPPKASSSPPKATMTYSTEVLSIKTLKRRCLDRLRDFIYSPETPKKLKKD